MFYYRNGTSTFKLCSSFLLLPSKNVCCPCATHVEKLSSRDKEKEKKSQIIPLFFYRDITANILGCILLDFFLCIYSHESGGLMLKAGSCYTYL